VEAEYDQKKFSTKIEKAELEACLRQHPQTERAAGASAFSREAR
jgi:hypothetical protein